MTWPTKHGSARIIRGNALALPLADASVDLICTSPPYFGLRSYQDGGEHYGGQIGSEATPAEFVDALVAATREMVRVLKPTGSIFVNLGDKYCADNRGSGGDKKRGRAKYAPAGPAGYPGEGVVRQKSLIGIPWRYALRCIDDLGLILRAEVIWSKPNGLPESVTDRVRRSHETWFHFTLQPRYFSAVDEIREPLSAEGPAVTMRRVRAERASGTREIVYDGTQGRTDGTRLEVGQPHPLGKLPGSVWSVPTQPLQVPAELGVNHFAAFPMEWPRRIIQGWSPAGVCVACGEGRRPLSEITAGTFDSDSERQRLSLAQRGRSTIGGGGESRLGRRDVMRGITGYVCACPDTTASTRPSVILDPFGGTGTTALVAKALGRHGVSVDMSADYCRLATWRTTDRGQMAAAMRVEKPEPVHPDQLALFGGVS